MPFLQAGGQSQILGRRATATNGLLTALSLYLPMNEAAGANDSLDLSANGLTFTQKNSPGADTGKVYATARTFTGTQYYERASATAIQGGNVDFTIAAWVYLTSKAAVRPIIVKSNGTSIREYELVYDSATDRFVWEIFNGSSTSCAKVSDTTLGSPQLSTWYLVCSWYDATAGKAYISTNNGTPVETTATGTPGTSTRLINLGVFATFYSGRIGPLMMWRSAAGSGGALSAAKRTALYNAGAGLTYAAFTA